MSRQSAASSPAQRGGCGTGLGLSAQQLKLIAVVAMVGDHLAWWLFSADSGPGMLLHLLGRITVPVMCFFVAEGCYHTSNLGRYFLRLLLCALPSHFAYVYYFRRGVLETTSVIWGLCCGLAALSVWRLCTGRMEGGSSGSAPALSAGPALLLTAGAGLVCCWAASGGDWSYTAVLWILACGMLQGQRRRQLAALAAVGLICYLLPAWEKAGGPVFYTLGIFIAVPLLALYNGRRSGRAPGLSCSGRAGGEQNRGSRWGKWGFYLFYPLHLWILGIVRGLLSLS